VTCLNTPSPTQIYTLSLHDALPILYLKVNRTVNDAKDSINKANDSLEEKQQILLEKINEIKQNTEEIQQREIIFQEMLKSFREAAAAKPEKKKWWKIWS